MFLQKEYKTKVEISKYKQVFHQCKWHHVEPFTNISVSILGLWSPMSIENTESSHYFNILEFFLNLFVKTHVRAVTLSITFLSRKRFFSILLFVRYLHKAIICPLSLHFILSCRLKRELRYCLVDGKSIS